MNLAPWLITARIMLLQFLIGTVLPCLALWLIYANLNAIWPHSGGVVVGLILLLYVYLATRVIAPSKPTKQ